MFTCQIAFVTVLHYQVNIVGRLLDIVELYDVVIVASAQHFDFVL